MTMQAGLRKRRGRRAVKRSDYLAFGMYGVRYPDAMKAAADVRWELVRRIEAMDRFLSLTEADYAAVADGGQPAKENLQEIRSWFSGELEIACRALGLDAGEVGEKAAVLEYDQGYPRRHAEIIAIREFLQAVGRYDAQVKDVVDSGLILHLARKFLDDRELAARCGCDTSILRYSRPQ